MTTPDPGPTDEQLAMLMAAADADAPRPDPAVLARLREQTLAAFQNAAPSSPNSLRKPTMFPTPYRWVVASVAAVLVLGLGVAAWFFNQPAPVPIDDDEKFVLADVLSEDGRIGKVTDAQGTVSVKPVLNDRWSPVQPRLVLKPGDWVRTDARGANAVALKLLKATDVIVGPHSTVELVRANELRVTEGTLEVSATADAPVLLHGPDQKQQLVREKGVYRVEKEKLVRVEKEPLWLRGFKGATANESLGSLIATVDGRNTPLTVGFHHVTVDIRDQIARTTIEESFVNRTNDVLEGVFHFPLPPDASISGFGMWVGDQLIEADVVEKERAREIYETILREKRDPGLLEWAGGNIFKARVYPIPANSEKRIKISYTQVLPLQGNQFRYSYALQSDMLKQHPLRELKVDVKVTSAVPLKAATSPTHACRGAKTDHSAHLEFSAQEYVPTRDFEAVFEVPGEQAGVVLVPHRRGDDGYFMLRVTPPGGAAAGDRPLIPNGEPLRLLILADTSASMDPAQRASQNAVITALLAALTPKDTVNVATCDVNCDWVFERAVPATPQNVGIVQHAIARRTSLGWTNLDAAFASAMKFADAGTHVVYVGDGILTTGDADPVAFAKRLRQMYDGKVGTFHAIAPGASYEPPVMKAIAALGGGSFRRVTGERGPQAAALELLTEIATPTLKNLKVEFNGVRTARVYPEELPNVAAGAQQVITGRYLPEGRDQIGEVVVTGTLAGKPVRMATKVSLADAERGNSFVPRLWAKMHLDKLLEQGNSPEVKRDVIALSEEFHIMTPYTSLLVLETDADRERFAVKRQFQVRDSEKFFAEGREAATFELKQKQMREAAAYRTALRRQALDRLKTLGRDATVFRHLCGPAPHGCAPFAPGPGRPTGFTGRSGATRRVLLSAAGGKDGTWGDDRFAFNPADARSESSWVEDVSIDRVGRIVREGGEVTRDTVLFAADDLGQPDAPEPVDSRGELKQFAAFDADAQHLSLPGLEFDALVRTASPFDPVSKAQQEGRGRERSRSSNRRTPLLWLDTVFPVVPDQPAATREPKTTWPAAAVALSKSLSRLEKLAQQKGGVAVVRQFDTFDPRHGDLTARAHRTELVSPVAWLTRTAEPGAQVSIEWCDGKEVGSLVTAFQLGRTRPAVKRDLELPPLGLSDGSVAALDLTHADFTAAVEAVGKDREQLALTEADDPDSDTRYLIDTAKHVVLRIEHRYKGKATAVTTFSEFVEACGTWWATRAEALDGKGRRVWLATQTVTEVSAEEFGKRMATELAGRDAALVLPHPLPTVADAKIAAASGKATLADRAVLTIHFAASQQWARAREHFDAAEKLAAGKPGVRWLTNEFLVASRRHEELRKRLLTEADALAAAKPGDNDLFLAEFLTRLAERALQTNEVLVISDRLQKVYDRQPAWALAAKAWKEHRVGLFQRSGQPEMALVLLKELANDFPRDADRQYAYARGLATTGDRPAACAWIDRTLASGVKWSAGEAYRLRDLHARLLEEGGRYKDLTAYLAAWLKLDPEAQQPYAMYLTALIRWNHADKAEALAGQWLRDAQGPGELTPPAAARLGAAIAFGLGQGYGISTGRIDEKWQAALAAAALAFARDEARLEHAGAILRDWRFSSTDAGRAAHQALLETLQKDAAKLTPVQIKEYVDWVWSSVPGESRVKLAAALRTRWDAEPTTSGRDLIAKAITTLLRSHPDEFVPFLHAQLKRAGDRTRPEVAEKLFDALLAAAWTVEREEEAFGLLAALADETAGGLSTKVSALHRLTDAMLERRTEASMKAVANQEKLTRTELQKKRAEALKLAREGLADWLAKEAAKAGRPLAPWLTAERLWLDVQLDRDPRAVIAECWKFLEAEAPAAKAKEGDEVAAALDALLRDRYLTTLQNLAARKGADPDATGRLFAFIDRQMKDHPDDAQWRVEHFRLLVARDKLKDLEGTLRQWVAAADADNRWRVALGYLLAERGQLPEAIKLFEQVAEADELSPAAYRSLATWLLVENHRDRHEAARAAAYRAMSEDDLNRLLASHLRPWQRSGHPPKDLDPEVLEVFRALFEKATEPQDYARRLREFYTAARDFRLLAVLADGVVGHSAERVYPFLSGMRGVLSEVRDEATADEIAARIAKVREGVTSPTDLRALDLLELLVAYRASELINQPGPHADRALAAMERAFKRDWSPGEPRLMAEFLADLGVMSRAALAKEQQRQLEALHRDAKPGTYDRLRIAQRYAETLNAYTQRVEAMDVLAAALKEYADARGGVLPAVVNGSLDTLIGIAEGARHFERGEKLLLAQLARPANAGQKNWLVLRLNELYLKALKTRGDVSLGKDAALFQALDAKVRADIEGSADQNHRAELLALLCRTYRAAHDLQIEGTRDAVVAFAFKRLPDILKDQVANYESIVADTADVIHRVAGPRDGIAFLLDRIEGEPSWVRYAGRDGWGRHGDRLAEWRTQAKDLGDLEPRLLTLVLADLRRDLRTRDQGTRAFADRHSARYWKEKEADFVTVAEEVYADRKQSGEAVLYIAGVLYHRLNREKRAVEMLLAADAQKLLDDSGRWQLVRYLHEQGRFAESVAVLVPMVERTPGNPNFRAKLMHAYFRTGKRAELLALFKQTDEFFHQNGRWGEAIMAQLAESCVENHLFAEAAAYYAELIPLHQRTHTNRGVGNGTLSGYYASASRAYSGLGKTREAADMASGAVVSWGPRYDQRKRALDALVQVLADAKDLNEYVAELDKDALQSAVVRKALGLAYMKKSAPALAVPQLRLAAELQPNDPEVHEALVKCLDALGDTEAANAALLNAVAVARREIKLYAALGKRYAEQNRPGDAERAFTSAVEVTPHESEGHALLAEVREKQNRWGEAIAHWERVAKIRSLEPTGLLKLAAAHTHERNWDAAAGAIKALRTQNWPDQFPDVAKQIRELEKKLEEARPMK
jgi:Flp pilus assembly protein TadD